MMSLVIRMLIIAAAHIGIGFLLCRAGALRKSPIFEFEFVVLYVPLFLAFAAYAYVFWFYGPASPNLFIRIPATIIIAILSTFLSLSILMFIVLNLYGS